MENLLSDVKTTHLKESFHRYMPTVMNNAAPVKKTAPAATARPVAHSGDRVSLVEQTQPKTNEETQDLQNILFLAGISAKAH
jgi:hypothetical protein